MNEGVYKNVHDRDEEECNTARRKINQQGAIAQMGERLLCTQEVGGSIPPGSTIVVSTIRLLKIFMVRVSGFGISERLLPGTRA